MISANILAIIASLCTVTADARTIEDVQQAQAQCFVKIVNCMKRDSDITRCMPR